MKKIIQKLPTPLVLLSFILSFITLYLVAKIPIFRDPDMSWHIMAGEYILKTGSIPKFDPFSFSGKLVGEEQVWYNISWLWDILLALVHRGFGIEGIYIFARICPALLVATLACYLQSRKNIGINALIFTALISTFAMMEYSYGRPQILAIFLALVFHHILHKNRTNQKSKTIFILPLLMILWVNIHGSFFAGFTVLGAFGLEAIFYKNYQWLKKLLVVSALCVLALLVNPYGVDIYVAVLRTMDSVITKYITEWKPFTFNDEINCTIVLAVFILVGNLRSDKAPLADKILAIAWLFVMLFSVRNIGFLSVLSAPYLAVNMPTDDMSDKHTRNLKEWINDRRFSSAILAFMPVLLVASLFLLPVFGKEHYLEKSKDSPSPAISYLTSHYQGKNILNDYNFGGRIIYESQGTFPVFIDGRSGTVYSERVLKDYMAFIFLEKDWEEKIATYKIDAIMVENNKDFVLSYNKGLYHDKWKQVFSDGVATIYERK